MAQTIGIFATVITSPDGNALFVAQIVGSKSPASVASHSGRRGGSDMIPPTEKSPLDKEKGIR